MNRATRAHHPPTNLLRFSVDLDDLSLPVAGQPGVVRDVPLFIPIDQRIDAAALLVALATQGAPGTISAALVQDRGSSGVIAVSRQPVVVPSSGVVQLGAAARLTAGHPVYLRLLATIPSNASTPWWSGASIYGTIHFTSEHQQ